MHTFLLVFLELIESAQKEISSFWNTALHALEKAKKQPHTAPKIYAAIFAAVKEEIDVPTFEVRVKGPFS